MEFNIGEQDLGGQFRSLSAQQSHQHDPPGNDEVDRDRPPNALGRVVGDPLDGAAGLENPVPIFNAPTQTVPA